MNQSFDFTHLQPSTEEIKYNPLNLKIAAVSAITIGLAFLSSIFFDVESLLLLDKTVFKSIIFLYIATSASIILSGVVLYYSTRMIVERNHTGWNTALISSGYLVATGSVGLNLIPINPFVYGLMIIGLFSFVHLARKKNTIRLYCSTPDHECCGRHQH